MTISQKKEGDVLNIAPEGRPDTVTAPQLERALKTAVDGISKLTLDLDAPDYVSSAGLRVLLSAQKLMNRQDSLTVSPVKPEITGIFEVTGFVDILNIAG